MRWRQGDGVVDSGFCSSTASLAAAPILRASSSARSRRRQLYKPHRSSGRGSPQPAQRRRDPRARGLERLHITRHTDNAPPRRASHRRRLVDVQTLALGLEGRAEAVLLLDDRLLEGRVRRNSDGSLLARRGETSGRRSDAHFCLLPRCVSPKKSDEIFVCRFVRGHAMLIQSEGSATRNWISCERIRRRSPPAPGASPPPRSLA